jgi:hypothetical protein
MILWLVEICSIPELRASLRTSSVAKLVKTSQSMTRAAARPRLEEMMKKWLTAHF